MRKAVRLVFPAAAFASVMILAGGAALASVAIQKKEKKPCATCHVKMGSKDLNNVGKYYKEKRTLDGAPKK